MIKMSCNEFNKLSKESAKQRDNCNLCKESKFRVGEKTGYGIIIYKIGGLKNGWFVTLSPKTGGNPKSDFTMQLMPMMHLTHFSQIHSYPNLAENFGIAFSKICKSMSMVLMKEEELMSSTEEKSISVPLATYGKCTTWKEKKEHIHVFYDIDEKNFIINLPRMGLNFKVKDHYVISKEYNDFKHYI